MLLLNSYELDARRLRRQQRQNRNHQRMLIFDTRLDLVGDDGLTAVFKSLKDVSDSMCGSIYGVLLRKICTFISEVNETLLGFLVQNGRCSVTFLLLHNVPLYATIIRLVNLCMTTGRVLVATLLLAMFQSSPSSKPIADYLRCLTFSRTRFISRMSYSGNG